jgi:hypothetical protein
MAFASIGKLRQVKRRPMDTLNLMPPAQTQAWDKLLRAEYSALYWKYRAGALSRIVLGFNVAAGISGCSALVLIFADYPLATKLVALVAAVLAAIASYSSYGADLEKARNLQRFYTVFAARYERVWLRSQQGIFEDVIFDELDALSFQSTD